MTLRCGQSYAEMMLYGPCYAITHGEDFMSQPVSQVDPPGLMAVRRNAVAAGDQFDEAQAAHVSKLGTGSEIQQWSTGSALGSATTAWTAFARQLAGQVQGIGADLSTAARDYEASDTASAARTGSIPAGHPAIGRAHGYGPQ